MTQKMPSSEMALKIEPDNELRFRGPFTSPVTSILKLTNPTDRRVIFKIKTTAPKRYCVRPNAGIIEPGAHLSVAVVLQPCELETQANRHKFMVQAIFAPAGEINQEELWRSSPSVMETKLRCHFEHPSSGADASGTGVTAHDVSASPPAEEKIQRTAAAHSTEAKASPPAHRDEHERQHAQVNNQQLTDDERRMIKRENKELKEEIERLRRKLKARVEAGDSMLSTGTVGPPPSQAMGWIVLTIIVAMLSVILGKFVL